MLQKCQKRTFRLVVRMDAVTTFKPGKGQRSAAEAKTVRFWPSGEWEPVRARVEQFPSFDSKASWWKRLLLGFEEHVSPDGSGRILLPPALRQHAKLERDAMMVGQGHYFELWDSGVWSAKLEQALSTTGAPPAGMEGFSL